MVMTLDDAITAAMQLSVADRIRLVARIAPTLEPVIDPPPAPTEVVKVSETETWGAQMVRLLDDLGLDEWQNVDMPDVDEWVKAQREQEMKHRLGDAWSAE